MEVAISLFDIQGLELDAVPSRCLRLQLLVLVLYLILLVLLLLLLCDHRERLQCLCDGGTVHLSM
jgi:hypothetical protein